MQSADQIWASIKASLFEKGCLNEVELRSGASEGELVELEAQLGVPLPDLLRHLLKIHDGQDGAGFLFGSQMLSATEILRKWQGWREIEADGMNEHCAEFMASSPGGVVKPMYTNARWIPLTHDGGGNHMGLDFDPDDGGAEGQMIAFGADEDTKYLLASTFAEFAEKAVAWIRHARWDGENLESPTDDGFAPPAILRTAGGA
ncbi:TPA: SMI1/KNR4 family protein [Stenotrophomonas maltophilia]|jgi:cell wall assembly regulator SMI1|nr:SMI1/KNR4 family protein [Stenotrophomonas maltophilia]